MEIRLRVDQRFMPATDSLMRDSSTSRTTFVKPAHSMLGEMRMKINMTNRKKSRHSAFLDGNKISHKYAQNNPKIAHTFLDVQRAIVKNVNLESTEAEFGFEIGCKYYVNKELIADYYYWWSQSTTRYNVLSYYTVIFQ
jgi:hypothetical protein